MRRFLRSFLFSLRSLFRYNERQEELDEEFQFHLDMRIRDLERKGISSEDARKEAIREFGGVENLKEACRKESGLMFFSDAWRSAELSVRGISKRPVACLVSILILAVGFGASVASYSILQGSLLRELLIHKPHELVRIWSSFPRGRVTSSDCADIAKMDSLPLADISFFRNLREVNIERDDESYLVNVCEASGSYFQLMGVNAQLGRLLDDSDDIVGVAGNVVISSAFRDRIFSEAETGLGETIKMNGRIFTIVGIVAPPFRGTKRLETVDVWYPQAHVRPEWMYRTDNYQNYTLLGRLKSGVTLQQAQLEFDAVAKRQEEKRPGINDGLTLTLDWESDAVVSDDTKFAQQNYLIFGIMVALLLLACINVSNILLTITISRRAEFSIKRSYGASGLRIFGELAVQGLFVSILAGILGFLLCLSFLYLYTEFISSDLVEATINYSVFKFSLFMVIGVGLLSSIVPSIYASRINISMTLRESSGRTSRRFIASKSMIVCQVAFSFVLLVFTSLFIRSLEEARKIDPGYSADGLFSFSINLRHLGDLESSDERLIILRILEDLKSVQGIEAVSVSAHEPLGGVGWTKVIANGYYPAIEVDQCTAGFSYAWPGFFDVMGIDFTEGRDITENEVEHYAEKRCVINQAMADRFWPDISPIGDSFFPWGVQGEYPVQVVGVVEDFMVSPFEEGKAGFFIAGHSAHSTQFIIRSDLDPEGVKKAIRKIVKESNQKFSNIQVSSLNERIESEFGSVKSASVVMTIISCIGLLITIGGICAIISYIIDQSKHEMGIRIALGAATGSVVGRFAKLGSALVVVGVVFGFLLSLYTVKFSEEVIYGISPWDVSAFLLAALLLLACATLVSVVTAFRATSISPTLAMKAR